MRRGRPSTGSLVRTKAGWAARITTTVDGERVRVQHQLGTTSRAAAQAKLARLLEAETPTSAEALRSETFSEAARRIVAKQNIKTESDRLRRLETWAFPELGALSVEAVKPGHIRSALEGMVKAGRSRTTCQHLLVDIATVLDDLWRDEVIQENPARRVRVPKTALVDARPRIILSEDEFSRFMACPGIDPELHMVALTSRCLGGMRTADLHAWDWSHVDVVGWASAQVSRPKTKSTDRLALPGMLVGPLRAWWDGQGRPTSGPVFPSRRGPRAGESKLAHSSYAERLREALWRAGVRRGATQAECELQTDTDSTRRVDFHRFRRAYATGLARAGTNVQVAMRLSGHTTAGTHQRYVRLTEWRSRRVHCPAFCRSRRRNSQPPIP